MTDGAVPSREIAGDTEPVVSVDLALARVRSASDVCRLLIRSLEVSGKPQLRKVLEQVRAALGSLGRADDLLLEDVRR